MEENSQYAPALRSTTEKILKEFELVSSHKFFTDILGTITGLGAVIDKNRQVVYANNEFLSLLGINSLEPLLGKRTGEIISCIHSADDPSGCGTSRSCAYCGAVNAILQSQRSGKKSMKEAHISGLINGKNKSWDLNVISTPVSFNGELFYILILQDISDIKMRAALERVFFHDLLNSAGALNGLLTLLKEGTSPEEASELINLSEEVSRNIMEEIIMQRQIRDAENHELKVRIELINSIDLLDSAIGKIAYHEAGKDRNIIRDDQSVSIEIESDRSLLERVIVNLLKNALEATPVAGKVAAGVRSQENKVTFWVKNDQVMQESVRIQVFQRSFSTKGSGRGIGTYSIRLLTENYLKGKVSFVSDEMSGTVFSIEINNQFPPGSV
jgi:nitrogen fixation/metabolism regulation signal transduction histidine kinase